MQSGSFTCSRWIAAGLLRKIPSAHGRGIESPGMTSLRRLWVRLRRSRTVVAVGVGLAMGAAVVGTRELGWLESWELGAYDNFLRARSTTEAPDRVSLVWIREEDFAEFDHPIPDWVIAEALETVLELGPRAVGVDVYRDRPVGVGWEMLGALLAAHPELVVV